MFIVYLAWWASNHGQSVILPIRLEKKLNSRGHAMLPAVWTLCNFVIMHNICKFEWNTLNVSTLYLIFDNIYMETWEIVKHEIWRDIPVILYWYDELVCCDLAKCKSAEDEIQDTLNLSGFVISAKKPTKNPILQPKQSWTRLMKNI